MPKGHKHTEWKCRRHFHIKYVWHFFIPAKNENRDPVETKKSGSGLNMNIDQRFFRNGFWSGSWSRLKFENRWSIFTIKPGIDFSGKIAIRSWKVKQVCLNLFLLFTTVSGSRGRFFNRDPIFFRKSLIDFSGKIGIRSEHENRSAIFPERILIAIVIAIEIWKSRSGWYKNPDWRPFKQYPACATRAEDSWEIFSSPLFDTGSPSLWGGQGTAMIGSQKVNNNTARHRCGHGKHALSLRSAGIFPG